MSPRNVKLYSGYVRDKNNLVYAASVSRATSNITTVDDFYTKVIKATVTQSVDLNGVSRRCYQWPTATSDVCFTQRAGNDDGDFGVKAFESMLWEVHATNMKAPSNGDKYNDNHYAVDTHVSGDYLATYFTNNNPYPLSQASTFAFSCTQDYIVDPTGWSIQVDLFFTTSYPGCGWKSGRQHQLVQPMEK